MIFAWALLIVCCGKATELWSGKKVLSQIYEVLTFRRARQVLFEKCAEETNMHWSSILNFGHLILFPNWRSKMAPKCWHGVKIRNGDHFKSGSNGPMRLPISGGRCCWGLTNPPYGWMDEGFNQYMNILSDCAAKTKAYNLMVLGQAMDESQEAKMKAPLMWSANNDAGTGLRISNYQRRFKCLFYAGESRRWSSDCCHAKNIPTAWAFKASIALGIINVFL